MNPGATLSKIQLMLEQLRVEHERELQCLSLQLRQAKDTLYKHGLPEPDLHSPDAIVAGSSSASVNHDHSSVKREPSSARREHSALNTETSVRFLDEKIIPDVSIDSSMAQKDTEKSQSNKSVGTVSFSPSEHVSHVRSEGTRSKTSRSLVGITEHEVKIELMKKEVEDHCKFELKSDWLKLPDAAEAFVEEVDRMLVVRHAGDMSETVKKSYPKPSQRLRNKSLSSKSLTAFLAILPSRFIINPASQYRIMWDMAGMLLISYDMAAIPIHLAFQPDSVLFTDFMGWVTLLFWSVDMVLSLFTGFYSNGVLKMGHRDIVRNYLQGWFWIDCVVVLPDWIMKAMGSMTNVAGLGRILRIARVIRVLRLLRLLKLKRLFDIVYDLIDSEGMFIVFNLIKLLCIILFMNHMVACAWYLIGRLAQERGQRNWLQDVGLTPVYGTELAWKYLTSLHWSMTQFTPASMDVYATNIPERMFSVVILFWALVALSSIIGSVSASMTALRNMSSDENKNFWILRRYLRQRNTSKDLQTRILKYLEYQTMAKQNVVHAASVKLLGALSVQFQEELAYEMCSPTLLTHPFFEHLRADETLMEAMRRICFAALQIRETALEELLFAPGDEGRMMYFIKKGAYVYTLLDGDNLDDPLTTKQWVAEAVLWTLWRHRGWMRATEPSEGLALNPTKFSEIVHLHPKPTYLAMHYGVDFVNYMNRIGPAALTDVIFDAEVWNTTVQASDTYVLTKRKASGFIDESSEVMSREIAYTITEHSDEEGAGESEKPPKEILMRDIVNQEDARRDSQVTNPAERGSDLRVADWKPAPHELLEI